MDRPMTMGEGGASVLAVRTTGIRQHGLVLFVALAFGITWLTMLGAFAAINAGILDPDGAVAGIASQLAAAGPLIAALIVLTATGGRSALAALARRLVRWRVNPLWYAYVFVGIPALLIAVLTIVRGPAVIGTVVDSAPTLATRFPIGVLMIAIFTGLAEEPGWRGFAQPWANRRHAPIAAAALVSGLWAIWHLPNMLFGEPANVAVVHLAATFVSGLVLAWIYNATAGSLLIVMLAHGANNVTASLFVGQFRNTPAGVPAEELYLIWTATFGIVVAVVLYLTKGRLGLKEDVARTR